MLEFFNWWQWLFIIFGVFLLALLLRGVYIWWTRIRLEVPRQDREWQGDCALTPNVHIADGIATFTNFRDFRWRTTKDRDEIWTERSVKIDDLVHVWYIVDHFHAIKALAHTMLSFEFKDGTFLAASFESRREKGEWYNPWAGLWRAYELYLAWGTERDVIGLRTNVRGNKVHLYRVVAPPGKEQEIFLEMCRRTQELAARAEWYHSIYTTCLTTIVRQVNLITPGRIPFTWRYVLPGHSTRAALRLGLIEDWGGYDETVRRGKVERHPEESPQEEAFSRALRAHMPEPKVAQRED